MSNFKKLFLIILKEQRSLAVLFAINFFVSFVLFCISIFSIKSDAVSLKIAYGDLGGYRDGSWTDMLVFPIMSCVIGVIHSLIAMRIFEKHGEEIAKIFSVVGLLLLAGLYVVFFRLVNEG